MVSDDSAHPSKLSKRFTLLVVSLSVILLGVFIADYYSVSYLKNNWQEVSSGKEKELALLVRSRLQTYQREASESVHQLSQSPELGSMLSGKDTLSEISFFEILNRYSAPDLSLELYDSSNILLSWSGNRNPVNDFPDVQQAENMFVLQGPIYTHFIFVSPVVHNAHNVGYVVGKRLFDVNYPISNRFINKSVFHAIFPHDGELNPDFHFSADAKPSNDGRVLSIELFDQQGMQIGIANLPRPMMSVYIEEVHNDFLLTEYIVGLLLLLTFSIRLQPIIRKKFSNVVRALVFIVFIWIVRYFLVWTNLPAQLVGGVIFDPAHFASSFGFGLARSVGDVFLSSLALLLSVGIISLRVLPWLNRYKEERNPLTAFHKILVLIAIPSLALLLCLFMRGYSATIHSAVFDSSLGYNNPTNMIPSIELSVILVSLLLVGISLVLAGSVSLFLAFVMIRRVAGNIFNDNLCWLIVALVFILVSVLFGAFQPNPLMGQIERPLYIGGFVLLSMRFASGKLNAIDHAQFRNIVLIAGSAVLLLVPQLDNKAHELDHLQVELVAQEINRPKDTWLKVILNQALNELSDEQTATILSDANADNIHRLAFTQWAKSILSKEGFNCAVTFVDSAGVAISDFNIGMSPRIHDQHTVENGLSSRSINIGERLESGVMVRLYTGYAPIRDRDSAVIGGVRLEVSQNNQMVLRQEANDMLRNYEKNGLESNYRNLIFSEYLDGKLISSTDDRFPLDISLPASLDKEYGKSVWLDQTIESKQYETYFLPERTNVAHNAWIALSMESLDARWHIYSITRYIVFFLLLGVCFFLIMLIIRIARGQLSFLAFRTRLFIAFMVVSFLPVAILALYNRQYTVERIEEATIKRLGEYTSIISAELQKQLGVVVPYALSQLNDAECEDIAGDMGTDFHVYGTAVLRATSKPELFTAELLDEHLSSGAYCNLLLKKKLFYSETQSIGNYQYIVGYRPLMAEDGNIIAVVAVPSLFRKYVLDEELTRSNVFLFGAYIVAMVCSFIIGTVFANQIAFPVRRLKEAAGRIAAGNLDIHFTPERHDELGELEQAFTKMSRDLKQAQEQMVRAQRELAWKEMAKQVAHEIKNPLTPMKLSIQHLRQAYKDGVSNFGVLLDQISTTVLDQIETLSRIASEFSHFGRMPERKLERWDLHEIMHEAANLFRQHTHVELVFDMKSSDVFVQADREELRRAFVNILRNSIQAMNERGRIFLSTNIDNGFIYIKVIDNGPGIREELRDRLFEPNFSTKTDGMGLGLSIVKNIIVDLGGSIEINSVMGEGTTVLIKLPASSEDNSKRGTSVPS